MRPFLFHRFRDIRNELVQSVKDFRLINAENDSRASKRLRNTRPAAFCTAEVAHIFFQNLAVYSYSPLSRSINEPSRKN